MQGFQGKHNRGTPRSYESDGLSADGREHPEDMETGIQLSRLDDDIESPWGTDNNESMDAMDGRSSSDDLLEDEDEDDELEHLSIVGIGIPVSDGW